MLLRETYTKFHIPSSRIDNYPNRVFESVLYYPEEDPDNYLDRRKTALTEYVRHDVKRFFGLNINEYLDLTYKEKTAILEVCQSEAKAALEAADKAKKNSDDEIKKLKQSMVPKIKTPKPVESKNYTPAERRSGFDFEEILGE